MTQRRQPSSQDPPRQHTAVVGLQWGDEGKGKIVDLLTARHDVIVRYNGGANAGHTVMVGDQRYALHLIPAGILYPEKLCVIANPGRQGRRQPLHLRPGPCRHALSQGA